MPHKIAVPVCKMAIRRTPLLLLVGVEDRGDALGISGEGRGAGALDLQQLADGLLRVPQPRSLAAPLGPPLTGESRM